MSNNSRADILVVDDDTMSRKSWCTLLVSAGYDCRESEDGARRYK
jgi:CheY-like chemotaxis protein